MATSATPAGIGGSSRKWSTMPPHTALGRILVAQRFACTTNWWDSCFFVQPVEKSVRSKEYDLLQSMKIRNFGKVSSGTENYIIYCDENYAFCHQRATVK